MMSQRAQTTGDVGEAEAPVKAFFDRLAGYYEHSWDTREHGLNVGIFEDSANTGKPGGDDLESGYQRSRDHILKLLQRIRPMDANSRALDVCCGTGATLSQIAHQFHCVGVGVDISPAQLENAVCLRNQPGNERRGQLLFREGTASLIEQVVSDQAPFTHVISQEGLLFAHDKPGAIQGIFDLLVPGGALVFSDFIPQRSRQELEASLRARVYEDVKWSEGLRFEQYRELLLETGFQIIQAELRPLDMQITYEKLIPRTQALAAGGDATYAFLASRYEGIVKAVEDGALSWGWFAARKP